MAHEMQPGNLKLQLDAQFRAPLLRFFTKRTGDRVEAEDLTQEVFMRLVRAKSLDQIEHVNAFVFKVADNVLRDRNRRASLLRLHDGLPPDDAAIDELTREFVEEFEPERVLVGRETLADVLRALDELGERTRNIYVLFRLENMKQKAIAELYGISASTVEKHVMRATVFLAERYGRSRR
jgi:RNA polymerase sigma factor (sigma-70 family)